MPCGLRLRVQNHLWDGPVQPLDFTLPVLRLGHSQSEATWLSNGQSGLGVVTHSWVYLGFLAPPSSSPLITTHMQNLHKYFSILFSQEIYKVRMSPLKR